MNRVKQKRAFTIMELLIAVAIVVILLAVSMPVVSSLASDLKMKELDTYARTIYIEAQNQLVTRRAEGGLDGLKVLMESSYADQNLGTAPQDFNTTENGDSWKQLYYLNAEDLLLSELIPAGSSFDGSFLIELNPQTGVVYSVFYWENTDAISYTGDILTLVNRSSEERASKKLGYFGGEVENIAQVAFDMDQKLDVVNGEELYAVISYRLSSVFARYYSTALTTTLTVKGTESGAVWTCPVSTTDMKTNNGRMELYVLLDSMHSGYSLDDITGGVFKDGENLIVQVESTFIDGAINVTETSSAVVNSLFSEADGNKITITTLRHLRNLDKSNYVHEGIAPQVILGGDIDFANKDFVWEISGGHCVYTGSASNPLSFFEPLENDTVFEAGGASFVGNNNCLKNFVIYKDTEENHVAMISKINGMNVSGVRVQDIKVTATKSTYTGTFAGSIQNCEITNCGVFLSTINRNGSYYSDNVYAEGVYANEMEERYYTRSITGGQYTGGFCGFADNVDFIESFAAIMVTGTSEVGGFCGLAKNGTTFTRCYSSGAVFADSLAGGLAGTADGAVFDNCYTTNSIAVAGSSGGFVAKSKNSRYTDCISYAALTGVSGQGVPAGSGVFLGESNTTDDIFTNCSYLKKDGGNAGLKDAAGISVKYWADVACSNPVSKSFPYSAKLTRTAFPFAMVTGSHYGNWQSQFVIDTSLVYYEVYKDNTYGYYCVTTLSETGSSETDSFTWVLDTLKDEVCVEDGYALLSIYNLESFDYMLNIGSVISTDDNYDTNTQSGTLTVSNEHGTGKVKLLRQQSVLTFKGYEGSYTTETDFSTKTVKNMFSVTGMYLYQLPYELQSTNRADVDKFYDRLVIYNGIAKNNTLGPVIGGANVTDAGALTFYYCPHFAKNAINPGLWDGTEKPDNPVEVSVRSARQLNALGRFVYYWNTCFGYTDKIYFVQESDISFSDYVTTYCGHSFNLMDTSASNPVRNRAIGQSKITTEKQFNNSYNGNFKKIIDYRLETDQQFAGFFGEVENGIIENIVMTVSEPYDPSNPDSKGGYIHGTYCGNTPSPVNGAYRLGSVAVGGIVGLSYKTNNVIRNCAISGYEIKYTSHTSGNTDVTNIAVGGLVGNSMGQIEYCSAACDVRVEINGELFWENSWSGGSISMGGLAGTAYFKEIKSCYSGGTIDISVSNDAYMAKINNLAAGGIAGAILKTYHDTVSPDATTEYKDLYSYTRIFIDPKFDTGVEGGNCYIAPIMVKEVFYPTWHHNRTPVLTTSDIVLTNCKYLDTAFNGVQDEGESGTERTVTDNYGAVEVTYGDLQDAVFAGMGPVNDAAHTFPVSEALADKTYNLPATVKDAYGQYVHYGDWPYRAVTRNLSKVYPGYFEIYEDGSVGSYYVDVNDNVRSTLINDLDILDAGYAKLKLLSEVEADDECIGEPIQLAGMTYYICKDETLDDPYEAGTLKTEQNTTMMIDYEVVQVLDGVIVSDPENPTIISKTLYVNPNFGASISVTEDLGRVEDNPFQVRTEDQLMNLNKIVSWEWNAPVSVYVKQTKHLDLSSLTQSIVLAQICDYDGGREEGFQMTGAPIVVFSQVNGYLHDVWSVGNEQNFIGHNGGTTEDCLVESAAVVSTGDTAIFAATNQGTIKDSFVKNSSYTATELNGAGFINCNYAAGVIENCGIYSETGYSASNISANQAAGFVFSNGGTIRNCFANCTMSTCNYTAGFIQTTEETSVIENCYANCQGYAMATGGVAYGFIERNLGSVINCYSAGLAKSASTRNDVYVYGFGKNMDTGVFTNCYSVCELVTVGGERYGFATGGTVTGCYWGYSNGINVGVDATITDGTRVTLTELSALTSIGALADNNVTDSPYDTTLGSNYPYPGVVDLVHYGDWPKAEGVSNRNSYVAPSGRFVGLFYYEKYTDGNYGIYAEGIDEADCIWNLPPTATTLVVNTLAEAAETVEASGYGLFYSEAVSIDKWTVQQIDGDASSAVTLNNIGSGLSLRISGYCFRIMTNSGTEYTKEFFYNSEIDGGKSETYTLTRGTIDGSRPASAE